MVICVPSQMSTVGLALNRTNFETHIIKPSPFFAGVYETVNGKSLDFEVCFVNDFFEDYSAL
jgi:hypothetical protein